MVYKTAKKSDFREILEQVRKLNGKTMRIVDSEYGTFDIYEVYFKEEVSKK